tara:strand:- start:85 stop:504 length:420 start_codon:yes stop_codon:yes gene_type:complete
MGDRLKDINVTLIVVLIIIFIYLLSVNFSIDRKNRKELNNIVSHKEIILPNTGEIERLKIENIIDNYHKKKSMNKSKYSSVLSEIKKGAVRGALGGALLGGDLESTVISSIIYGMISGVFKAYNQVYPSINSINGNKPV